MKTLLLETSSEYAVIASMEGERILDVCCVPGGPLLSKSLGLEIQKIIDRCPPPYNRIVVGIGPGSFTGIRMGASMAQALAFGWNVPLYTTSSLHAFASPASPNAAVAIDARSGGIYVQIGAAEPRLLSLSDAELCLQNAPLIASPHPSRILARLPSLASAHWIETRPDPFSLARCALPAQTPLSLHYLSTPPSGDKALK